MSKELNKTEADFAYERYTKMSSPHPEQSIPINNEVSAHNSDPVWVGDPYIGADIGLNSATEREDLLESDAILAAETAGLTGSVIDYAEDEELMEDEDQPLEDIPDADEIEPGTAIDPASPPVDAMPGTDVINGFQGE